MRPTWLIEADIEGLPSAALQAEIQRQGMRVQVVKPFLHSKLPRDILGAESIPLDACVLFKGTSSLLRHIRRTRRWVPGGWCNFENLACSNYYAWFGDYLLNRNYAILPIAEAQRLQVRLCAQFARKGHVFVRPDAMDKSFTGKLVDVEELESFLASQSLDPTKLVLLAEPQEIVREWRLFLAQSQILTGSQYAASGERCVAAGFPVEVGQFASQVLEAVKWRPDPLFVMDVCEAPSGLRIVELNGYSCSGLYECDLEKYVSAASRCAELAW